MVNANLSRRRRDLLQVFFPSQFMDFKLRFEFVELDNMLKALNLVASGAEARQYIQAGSVKVNGQVETRVRRKLRLGDSVEFGTHCVRIVSQS